MEFEPIKIDWQKFQDGYRDLTRSDWKLEFDNVDASDIGSLNVATADTFANLEKSLSENVREPLAGLAVAVATVRVGDRDYPDEQPDDWNEIVWGLGKDEPVELPPCCPHGSLGRTFSPATVQRIVTDIQSVTWDAIAADIARAWPDRNRDPANYKCSDPDDFSSDEEFIEYLAGWFGAFEQAAGQGHAIGIDGG